MKGQAFITIFALAALVIGCAKSDTAATTSGTTGSDVKTTSGDAPKPADVSKLKTETLTPGKGEGAKDGDMLTMLYRGTLTNGTLFDGNMNADTTPIMEKDPFPLTLGMGSVIKGWDEGLKGIKVGEVRRISIPSELGYGAAGSGSTIPPNADLMFDVKCLDIIKVGEEMVIDTKDQKVGTGPAVKNGDTVEIHYVGKLLNGKQFDSSRDRKQTFKFKVGAGEVVPGFDKAVTGMQKGGIRTARIPPQAAYGANPSGGLPGNSVLNFELELISVNGK